MTDRSTPPKPALALSGLDVLLVLILSLGGARLLGLLIPTLFHGIGMGDVAAHLPLLIFCLITSQSLVMVAVVWRIAVQGRGLTWQDLGLRPTTRSWVLRSISIALLAIPVMALVNLGLQSFMDSPPSNPQMAFIKPAGGSLASMIGLVVAVGVFAPFAEELAFRGLFYGWLKRRWNLTAALLVSSACFSVLHGIVWLIPVLALLGLVLALIYEKSGSLWPAVIAHGAFNTMTVLVIFAGFS